MCCEIKEIFNSMKKLFCISLAAITYVSCCFGQNQQEQVEIQFTGTPWGVINVSENNRYLVGTRQYTEIYSYDMETKTLLTIPAATSTSDLGGVDITNSGVIIGNDDDKVPAIYKDGVWHKLPIPEGKFEGIAYSCTADGEVLIGQIYGTGTNKPYKVYPLIWYRQEDDTYQYENLPDPETDFIGGETQFNSPRFISADGKLIFGIQVEEHGRYFTNIIYTKNNSGEWEVSTPFVKYCFNPERIKEISASEPNLDDYTAGGGDYMENINRFLLDQAKWQYKLYTEGLTGLVLNAPSAVNSQDGKFVAFGSQRVKYTLVEENPSVEKEGGPVFPSIYNTETGELCELDYIENFAPYGISNYGDMIYSNGTCFYLLLHGEKQAINITDWLKDKYNFDLMASLPAKTEYVECDAIGSDLSFLAGTYRSVREDGELDKKEVFCLLLPSTGSLIETLNIAESEFIWAENKYIHFSSPVTQVYVYDMNGMQIGFENSVEHKLNMESFPSGIYIVKAVCNGKSIKGRIILR